MRKFQSVPLLAGMKPRWVEHLDVRDALCWQSIFCLFAVVHLTQNRLQAGIDIAGRWQSWLPIATEAPTLLHHAPVIKGAVFWLALAVLTARLVRELLLSRHLIKIRNLMSTVGVASSVTLFLAALSSHLDTVSMGKGYALRSLDPFAQSSDWYHKRILMPALGHILGFRGDSLYFVFSLLVVIVFLGLLLTWLKNNAPISWWQFLSLVTGGFVIHQLQHPGYPDPLMFCFLLGVLFSSTSHESRFRLLILALLTHEASLFVGIPLALRYLDKRCQIRYAVALALYGFIWLACSRFQVGAVLSSHFVEGRSSLEWTFLQPSMMVLGIFFGFKVLWALPLWGVVKGRSLVERRDFHFIVATVVGGLLVIFLGVDTSRMISFAFPAVLVALKALKGSPSTATVNRVLVAVFLVNLLVPAVSVGLNNGLSLAPGLYQFLWGILSG